MSTTTTAPIFWSARKEKTNSCQFGSCRSTRSFGLMPRLHKTDGQLIHRLSQIPVGPSAHCVHQTDLLRVDIVCLSKRSPQVMPSHHLIRVYFSASSFAYGVKPSIGIAQTSSRYPSILFLMSSLSAFLSTLPTFVIGSSLTNSIRSGSCCTDAPLLFEKGNDCFERECYIRFKLHIGADPLAQYRIRHAHDSRLR